MSGNESGKFVSQVRQAMINLFCFFSSLHTKTSVLFYFVICICFHALNFRP